jgi:hypothetical protein
MRDDQDDVAATIAADDARVLSNNEIAPDVGAWRAGTLALARRKIADSSYRIPAICCDF